MDYIDKKTLQRSAQQEKDEFINAIFSLIVENESGVLSRVIGLFAGRGYNIESLTVAPVDDDGRKSRINILTSGTPMVINQIKEQLNKQVPVYQVVNLCQQGPYVARELALIKVVSKGLERAEALNLAGAFRAQVVDASVDSLVFELTGKTQKINAFVDLLRPLGLVELSRTGIAAIGRGCQTI
ncbi:acetolactate synthase small subunit [Commensalibacter intestini A911]|uniref:Acetolactate synthase small subunit n=2 Tax=Commensalibacter intestini TaxID=479936 RepID=A0A251ZWA0_9PROT|nr:acetolactate synthase small subunit [Commensalibacter intestini]EHD14653.1 acetolactate synthase small subunit [Commensalibacter intestini A911]OUI78948.1 acetolactate synthase [Commensalibacter intestini]